MCLECRGCRLCGESEFQRGPQAFPAQQAVQHQGTTEAAVLHWPVPTCNLDDPRQIARILHLGLGCRSRGVMVREALDHPFCTLVAEERECEVGSHDAGQTHGEQCALPTGQFTQAGQFLVGKHWLADPGQRRWRRCAALRRNTRMARLAMLPDPLHSGADDIELAGIVTAIPVA